jgi:RND family efflux transporter MFP subunit
MSQEPESDNRTADDRRTRRRPALALRIILPLAVLAAGVALSFWLLETSPKAQPKPKTRNAALVEVRTIEFATQESVVSAMGTVRPSREVSLRPQVSGEIIEMAGNFLPGGHFRKGETLLKIDPTDYRLAVRQLASEVARAESELQIEQGNQLVAQKEYELLGETVSEEETSLMLRRPQLDNLRAALEAAQARLEQARINLRRTEIAAPFNAVVQSREINIGTRVSEGTALTTLIGTDSYWVEVSVPVSQLRWIRIPNSENEEGSMVRVYDRAAWGEGAWRTGKVIRLSAGLEEQGRMARLLVKVVDPLALLPENAGAPRMLIGSYVRVEIEGRELPSAAAIDRNLIQDGDTLWIMDDENRLDVRQVEIAFRGREQVLVTGGIEPGERLVVSPLPGPAPGMALRLEDKSGEASSGEHSAPEPLEKDVQR